MKSLLEVDGLTKIYPMEETGWRLWPGRGHSRQLQAVDNVSFSIASGESLGLVGESGCGKSTVVRLVARLIDTTSGKVTFDGRDIAPTLARNFSRDPLRRAIQVVFQDPTDSLDPRYSAADVIAEPIRLLGSGGDRADIRARVIETARLVGLTEELLPRLPHQLSGGQKARVNIARAVVLRPQLLILDEPTSALDVSVQAVIIRLLDDLRTQLGMSYLFVSHDLNVVRLLCQNVAVMYLGRIVEMGPADELFEAPRHPYTRALIQAIPGRHSEQAERLIGEPMSPIDPDPSTCRLHGRCPIGHSLCQKQMPQLETRDGPHAVACHTPIS